MEPKRPEVEPTASVPMSLSGTGTGPETLGGSPLNAIAVPERIGEYAVLGELGRGGMGVVYRAEDPGLKREVALKVMLPQFAANPQAKARFVREARAQAKVEHEHVAVIHHVAEDAGVPYLVMPLLKGMTLHAALRANPRPPLTEVLRIAREVAEGLAAAHEQGLVHRDIKPANVWLEGKKLRVKVLDFGLARPMKEDAGAQPEEEQTARATDHPDPSLTQQHATLTREGAVVGTPSYMSPEQAAGLAVDGRTDLWSLGVMLYQMTTGELPFRGPSPMGVLIAVSTEHPPAPIDRNPSIPPPISDLVMRLLAKNPEHRVPTAEALVEQLRAVELGLANAVRVIPLDGAPPPIIVAPEGPDPFAELDATIANTTALDAESSGRAGGVNSRVPIRRGFPVWGYVATALLAVGVVVGIVANQLNKKPTEAAKDDPPPSKRDIPQRDNPPPVNTNPKNQPAENTERRVAELFNPYAELLLRLTTSQKLIEVAVGQPLPTDDFVIISIGMPKGTMNRPADFATRALPALATLTTLISFYEEERKLKWSDDDLAKLAASPCREKLRHFQAAVELTPRTIDSLAAFPLLVKIDVLASEATDDTLAHLTKLNNFGGVFVLCSLGRSGGVTNKGWAVIAGMRANHLELIDIRGLNKEVCEHIARMPNLHTLGITNAILDWQCSKALAQAPKLHKLTTGIADNAIKLVSEFRALRYLSVASRQLSDQALADLATLTQVRDLRVLGNVPSAEREKQLNAALPRCTITWKDRTTEPSDPHYRETIRLLRHEDITVGLKLADGKTIKRFTKGADLPEEPFTLVQIVRPENGTLLDHTDLKRLEATPTLEVLDTPGLVLTDAGLRSLLASRNTLSGIVLSRTPFTDEQVKLLAGCPKLEGVGFDSTKITDAGLAHLAGLTKLYTISVGSTAITDAGLKHLAALPALRVLWVHSTAVSDAAIETLSGMKGLTELNLRGTRITAAGLKQLQTALPKCQIHWDEPNRAVATWLLERGGFAVHIRLSDKREVQATKHSDLPAGAFTIIDVSTVNGQITDEVAGRVAMLPSLQGFRSVATHTLSEQGLKQLLPLKGSLRTMTLNNGPITDEGLKTVGQFTEIVELGLVSTQVTHNGVKHLTALPKLRSLSIQNTALTDAAIEHLSQMKGLTNLNVTRTRITAQGYEKLRQALPGCKIVWEASVQDNLLPADGWVNVTPLIDAKKDHAFGVGTMLKTKNGFEGSHGKADNGVRLRVPLAVSGDYELEVEFTRPKGEENSVFIDFPIGAENGLSFTLDSMGKTGLEFIDNKPLSENGTGIDFRLGEGHRTRVALTVRTTPTEALVEAFVDGKQLLTLRKNPAVLAIETGNYARQTIDVSFAPPGKLVIHEVKLRMLSGEAKRTRPEDAPKLVPPVKKP